MKELKTCGIFSCKEVCDDLKSSVLGQMDCFAAKEKDDFLVVDILNRMDRNTDVVIIDLEAVNYKYHSMINEFLADYPHINVIVITRTYNNVNLKDLIRAGIKACLDREDFHAQINQTIGEVLLGKYCFSRNIPFEALSQLKYTKIQAC